MQQIHPSSPLYSGCHRLYNLTLTYWNCIMRSSMWSLSFPASWWALDAGGAAQTQACVDEAQAEKKGSPCARRVNPTCCNTVKCSEAPFSSGLYLSGREVCVFVLAVAACLKPLWCFSCRSPGNVCLYIGWAPPDVPITPLDLLCERIWTWERIRACVCMSMCLDRRVREGGPCSN